MYWKKILATMLCVAFVGSCGVSCFAGKPSGKSINVNGGLKGIALKKAKINESIKHRVKEFEVDVKQLPLIAGDQFNKLAKVEDYECHHLISRRLIKNFKAENREFAAENINEGNAPSILLRKDLHKQTGSYVNTKSSRAYNNLEKFFYIRFKLLGVLILGIEDMQRVLQNNNYKALPKESSPLKNCTKNIDILYSNKLHTITECVRDAIKKTVNGKIYDSGKVKEFIKESESTSDDVPEPITPYKSFAKKVDETNEPKSTFDVPEPIIPCKLFTEKFDYDVDKTDVELDDGMSTKADESTKVTYRRIINLRNRIIFVIGVKQLGKKRTKSYTKSDTIKNTPLKGKKLCNRNLLDWVFEEVYLNLEA